MGATATATVTACSQLVARTVVALNAVPSLTGLEVTQITTAARAVDSMKDARELICWKGKQRELAILLWDLLDGHRIPIRALSHTT